MQGTAVSQAYAVPFKFNGKIGKVTIELKATTPATAEAAEKARRESALKLALSN